MLADSICAIRCIPKTPVHLFFQSSFEGGQEITYITNSICFYFYFCHLAEWTYTSLVEASEHDLSLSKYRSSDEDLAPVASLYKVIFSEFVTRLKFWASKEVSIRLLKWD